MSSQQNLSLSVTLPYAQAGIEFRLHGECHEGAADCHDWQGNDAPGRCRPMAARGRKWPPYCGLG